MSAKPRSRAADPAVKGTPDWATELFVTSFLDKLLVAAKVRLPPPDADAYSIQEFCERHGISSPMFYKIANAGLAPETFTVGTRVLVSKEAAAAWRKAREAATAAEREHWRKQRDATTTKATTNN